MNSFFLGVLTIIFLLVIAVYIRRFIRNKKIKKYKSRGGNSRESVGENVVAVLNGKIVKENWIDKFDRKLRGG